MWGAISHVGDVVPLGAPYTGVRSWAVSPEFSRVWYMLCAWLRTCSSSVATSRTLERRRTPTELRTWSGRQKRARRTVLAGWDRQARLRALERGRKQAR